MCVKQNGNKLKKLIKNNYNKKTYNTKQATQ